MKNGLGINKVITEVKPPYKKWGEKMKKLTNEEEQIREVILAARTLEEYLWESIMVSGI